MGLTNKYRYERELFSQQHCYYGLLLCHSLVRLEHYSTIIKLFIMMKAFKIDFHNGEKDMKTIVTMSVSVKNQKRFNSLDQQGKAALVEDLVKFRDNVTRFTADVINSMSK